MSKRPEIVNRSAQVYRGDGLRLYGLDAELEQKMQAKRDLEFEAALGKWISQVIEEPLPEATDLVDSLRSGEVLCKLINKIAPGTIKKYNTKPVALLQMENIGLYLKACWKLGVPSQELFVSSDLFSRKDIAAVVRNIYSLARLAPTISTFKGPVLQGTPKLAPRPLDAKPPPKWDIPSEQKPLTIADIEREEEEERKRASSASAIACAKCGTCLERDVIFCTNCGQRMPTLLIPATPKSPEQSSSSPSADENSSATIAALRQRLQTEEQLRAKLEAEISDLRAQIASQQQEILRLRQQIQIATANAADSDAPPTRPAPRAPTGGNELREAQRMLENERRARLRAESEAAELKQQIAVRERAVSTASTPQSIDSRQMLLFIQECVEKILLSRPDIELADMHQLRDMFKLDAGRRSITRILKQTMKKTRSLVLSNHSFELLLFLINTILQEMDVSSSKDLHTAKVLMTASESLCRLVAPGLGSSSAKQEYVKDFIRGYDIWQSLSFWEQYFWDELSTVFRMCYSENQDVDDSLAATFLTAFASLMHGWGVTEARIRVFLEDMCYKNEIDPETYELLKLPSRAFTHFLRTTDSSFLAHKLQKLQKKKSKKSAKQLKKTLTTMKKAMSKAMKSKRGFPVAEDDVATSPVAGAKTKNEGTVDEEGYDSPASGGVKAGSWLKAK